MPSSYWVCVGLLALIALQCFVIEGARRVYERTVQGFKTQIAVTEILGVELGKLHQLFEEVDHGRVVPQNILEMWLLSLETEIREGPGLGRDALWEFNEGRKTNYRDVPEKLGAQREWIGDYMIRIRTFIKQQDQESIALRKQAKAISIIKQ